MASMAPPRYAIATLKTGFKVAMAYLGEAMGAIIYFLSMFTFLSTVATLVQKKCFKGGFGKQLKNKK